MRKYLFAIAMATACSEPDTFECDRNAQFEYNGKTECAFARVENYSITGTKLEGLTVFVTGGPTDFTFQLFGNDLKANTDYSYPDNASIYGPGHNQTFSLRVTLTQLDLQAKVVSGTFSFETERDVNSAGVPFNSSGKFTNIPF